MAEGHTLIVVNRAGDVFATEFEITPNHGYTIDTATALTRLIQDPQLRYDMGRAGRNRVEHSYRQTEVIDRYENLYRRLPLVKTAPFTSAALPGIAFQHPHSF